MLRRIFIIATGVCFTALGSNIAATAQNAGETLSGVAMAAIFGLTPIAIGLFAKSKRTDNNTASASKPALP